MRPTRFALVAVALFATLFFAPVAHADSYTDALASKFAPNRHVVADTAATPPLANADKLNAQVLGVRNTPIWIAAVAANQTGITTPDALHAALKHNGVYLVIDAKGYHDKAFGVTSTVANGVAGAMSSSAADHHNDPYGATSEFVSKVAAMSNPTNLTPVATPKPARSLNWLWWTLGIIAAIAAVLAAIWAFAAAAASRERREREQNSLRTDLITHQGNLDDLDSAVVDGADVSTQQRKATVALGNAQDAYDQGDYTAARAHLRTVVAAVAQADRKLHKAATPDLSAVAAVAPEARKSATVQATDPSGAHITINNTNYRTSRSSGYNNYYGGGMLNGMYFYPGYYPYNYWGSGWGWSPTDVLIADALLEDRWGGNYNQSYQQSYDSPSNDVYFQDSSSTSNGSDTSFDGSSTSSSSDSDFDGGSDTSFEGSSYSPSYSGGGSSDDSGSSSSYDSGSSSSSYDGGSSHDSGGGGSDFGGGGDSSF